MKNLFLLLMTLTSLVSVCLSQDQTNINPTIKKTIEQIKFAVNNKDFDTVSGYLSEEYQYQGMARPMSVNILKQVIQQFPKIDSIIIDNTTSEVDKVIVDVTIHIQENASAKTVILDHDNKILSADIADLSIQGHGSSSSNSSNTAGQNASDDPPFKSMPFYLTEGQMVVEAIINGKKGNFIVDSGTPGKLMLNSNFQSYQSIGSTKNALGVSGEISNTAEVTIESFEWNGLAFNDIKALSVNLDHLGKNLNVNAFAGTIGYGILKDFIVEFDYQDNKLKLWKNPDLIKENYGIKPEQIMPFSMAFHLPVIKAKVGDRELRFGLDSGAESNMIEPGWKPDLEGKYEPVGVEKLAGADTNYIDVLKVSLGNISIKEKAYSMDFIFAKLFGGQHEVTLIDGLIGYPFLSYRKTAVNYLDNELYFIN